MSARVDQHVYRPAALLGIGVALIRLGIALRPMKPTAKNTTE